MKIETKNHFAWAVILLLVVLLTMTAQTARATTYITDVMVIGCNEQADANSKIATYADQGYTVINKDLNAGAGGQFVYLLYKTGTDANNAITDIYIQTGEDHPDSQTIDGRTFNIVPHDGDSDFTGDLNSKVGGEYIFLYYTKDAFSPSRLVNNIYFNSNPSGAVGAKGGTSGYDLNSGAANGGENIYMHVSTEGVQVQTNYITDVMVIAGTGFETIIYRQQYQNEGWTIINKNLNEGTEGNLVYLLYKTNESPNSSGTPITGFYLKGGKDPARPETILHDGRTYYLAPSAGNNDLNYGADGDYIFLYYTKDAFTPGRWVTDIYFNSNASGAVGKDGGTSGYDLNCNAGGEFIYMHVTDLSTEDMIEVGTEAQLRDAVASSGANIRLIANIDIAAEVVIQNNAAVTLDLNGHTLNRGLTAKADNGHVLKVLSGCSLTINDSSGDDSGLITGGYAQNGGAIDNVGTLVINGGTINGNHATYDGAGIYNHDGGSLTINGGYITNNQAFETGGIKNASGSSLVMNNGTVTGNTADSGGGGITNQGTAFIYSGTISNNSTTTGGGIWTENALTISGGTIEGNAATNQGGGVYVNGGSITLSGGVITNNQSREGIYIGSYTNSVNMQGNPQVFGNLNTDGQPAANVHLHSGQKITITGAFTEGAYIGLTHDASNEMMTSGFLAKNPDTEPTAFFFADTQGYGLTLLEGEIISFQAVTSMDSYYVLEDGTLVNQTGCRKVSQLTDALGVTMANGWYVVDQNCTFNHRITITGTVNLILANGFTLKANKGIYVPNGADFHVWGQHNDDGILNADAQSMDYCAGIGASRNTMSGRLFFHGGQVNGVGGYNATGIGGTIGTSTMDITITGGVVVGIGGDGDEGRWGPAGIGTGVMGQMRGDIVITGGNVLGVGSLGGAGIGTGYDGYFYTRDGEYSEVPVENSSIRISGGIVSGISVGGGAGIGGGRAEHAYHGCLGNLYITGGTVDGWSAWGDVGTMGRDNGSQGIGHGYFDFFQHETYRGEVQVYANAKVEATTSDDLKAPVSLLPKSKRDDFYSLTATPFYKHVIISPCEHNAEGVTFSDNGDGTHTVSGCPYCKAEIEAHTFTDGKCVCGATALILADNADNSTTIANHDGMTTDVTLQGRTLYKDGAWNTLCLPFEVSTASSPLSGDNVQAMTLNTTTSNLADGTLTLNFDAAETIPAGTPFIIKWDGDGSSNITNPVFESVTVSNAKQDATVAGVLTFTGTYAPVTTPADGDNTKLYLGSANTLYYPNAAMTIGTHRAYFQLAEGITAGEPVSGSNAKQIRAFNLNFGDDEATGIITTSFTNSTNSSNEWYSLDGRMLNGKPMQRGIYINNGKKTIIK